MRILITFDDGRPHGLGRGGFIVDNATHAYVQELLDAKAQTPDEILTIPNARVHATAATSGTASLRAGHIETVREF